MHSFLKKWPIVLIPLWVTLTYAQEAHKFEILLVGSPHWSNYKTEGLDVIQTNEIDILDEEYQAELEIITNKIKEFGPDKIFIESTVPEQPMIDSLYTLYINGDWGAKQRSESIQMAFRAAKKLGHSRVYCADFKGVSFDFDSVMTSMARSNQNALMQTVQERVGQFQSEYNELIKKGPTLKEVFEFLNSRNFRRINLGFYVNLLNRAGNMDDFAGSFLVSEWYRRNLYIYAQIQKSLEKSDEKAMLLMGAGHIAVIEDFIKYQGDWKIVELINMLE